MTSAFDGMICMSSIVDPLFSSTLEKYSGDLR